MPESLSRNTLGIIAAFALAASGSAQAAAGGAARARPLYQLASTASEAPATYGRYSNPELHEVDEPRPAALLTLGPSLGIIDGSTGFGASAEVLFRLVDSSFFIGFESGLLHWSGSAGGISASLNVIPLVVSSRYRFEGIRAAVAPYIGLGAGAGLAIGSASANIAGSAVGGSASTAVFMGDLRPGVEFLLSRGTSLYVEPKIGLLKTSFLFSPSLGLSVAL